MQIPQLHQDVEIISGPGNSGEGLEAPEDTLFDLIRLSNGQLINQLFACTELFKKSLDLVVSA